MKGWLRIEDVLEKVVVDQNGTRVGELADLYLSEGDLNVSEFQIKLEGSYASDLGLGGAWFRDVFVLVERDYLNVSEGAAWRLEFDADDFQSYIGDRRS
jgi:sporulation protein YlmC with PRC-barrel domain